VFHIIVIQYDQSKTTLTISKLGMSQQYVVYESWTRDRTHVHKVECKVFGACRNPLENSAGINGKWYGPFRDRSLAFKTAAGLNRAEARACRICSP
jgi:hypothetical protein